MKKKLIVFHPAIAPYRVDFFNSIDEIFDAKFYFEFDNALEQTFDQKRLQEYLSFIPKYLSPGFWVLRTCDLMFYLYCGKIRLMLFSFLSITCLGCWYVCLRYWLIGA